MNEWRQRRLSSPRRTAKLRPLLITSRYRHINSITFLFQTYIHETLASNKAKQEPSNKARETEKNYKKRIKSQISKYVGPRNMDNALCFISPLRSLHVCLHIYAQKVRHLDTFGTLKNSYCFWIWNFFYYYCKILNFFFLDVSFSLSLSLQDVCYIKHKRH